MNWTWLKVEKKQEKKAKLCKDKKRWDLLLFGSLAGLLNYLIMFDLTRFDCTLERWLKPCVCSSFFIYYLRLTQKCFNCCTFISSHLICCRFEMLRGKMKRHRHRSVQPQIVLHFIPHSVSTQFYHLFSLRLISLTPSLSVSYSLFRGVCVCVRVFGCLSVCLAFVIIRSLFVVSPVTHDIKIN